MPGTLRIGRIAGIRIEMHFSWLLLLAQLTVSLATSGFPYALSHRAAGIDWAAGFAAAMLLFASVLAHELGHSLVARTRHLSVHNITLFIFGGVSNLEQEPPTARVEFQVAVAGPIVSAAIAAIVWPLGLAIATRFDIVGAILVYLGIANLLLAVFNLLPAFPLDGGRILRAALWVITDNSRRATRWASLTSQGIALIFILASVWTALDGRILTGVWMGFMGFFLFYAARTADAQTALESALRGVTVRDIMDQTPITVPATITLPKLMGECLAADGLHAAPVVHAGQFLGLVTLSDVFAVGPDDLVGEALTLMNAAHINQFPVVQGWRLAGMLSCEAIARYIAARRGLSRSAVEHRVADPIERLSRAS